MSNGLYSEISIAEFVCRMKNCVDSYEWKRNILQPQYKTSISKQKIVGGAHSICTN